VISEHVRDSKKYKVVKCVKCKHAQIFPIPKKDEDKKFYDEDRQAKNINYRKGIEELKKKTKEDTIRRVKLINKYAPKNGSVLEIGSGYGIFLEEIRKHGYKVIGIEISNERRRYSKKITNVKVLNINLNEQIPDIGKFDIIVLFQVLEHIVDPINFLRNLKKLLRSRGKLIVEVPNFNDFQLGLNKAYSEWYWQRAHIHYFSPRILKRVLLCSGFKAKILGMQRYSIENMFNWKLTNHPQLTEPTYNLPKKYDWIEKHYKKYLEKYLICDTIIAIGTQIAKSN
jgi:2-polyprenyl-3-methyl-5-hydroxy-6-metoxy-1,4-benzoquinol methylase